MGLADDGYAIQDALSGLSAGVVCLKSSLMENTVERLFGIQVDDEDKEDF